MSCCDSPYWACHCGDTEDSRPPSCCICGERIPTGAGGPIEGEGDACQDCFAEWKAEERRLGALALALNIVEGRRAS